MGRLSVRERADMFEGHRRDIMELEIMKLSDEDLQKEISFAEGFGDMGPLASQWLELLEGEQGLRRWRASRATRGSNP